MNRKEVDSPSFDGKNWIPMTRNLYLLFSSEPDQFVWPSSCVELKEKLFQPPLTFKNVVLFECFYLMFTRVKFDKFSLSISAGLILKWDVRKTFENQKKKQLWVEKSVMYDVFSSFSDFECHIKNINQPIFFDNYVLVTKL